MSIIQEMAEKLVNLTVQEAKLEKDAKEMVEAFNKEIQKQEEQQRKLEIMREHPEWFETTSPKEYGMLLMKRKKK